MDERPPFPGIQRQVCVTGQVGSDCIQEKLLGRGSPFWMRHGVDTSGRMRRVSPRRSRFSVAPGVFWCQSHTSVFCPVGLNP